MMSYVIVFSLAMVAIPLHWHFYSKCLFNEDINRPPIYRSYKGELLVTASKILWFGTILFFFKWYFVLIPILILIVLQRAAFLKFYRFIVREELGAGATLDEARKMATAVVRNLHRH